jgi:hypothetical protein
VNSKEENAVVTSSEAPSLRLRKVHKIRNISVTMAGESVQNLTGQLLNKRGATITCDSYEYLNVINIGPCIGNYFLQ